MAWMPASATGSGVSKSGSPAAREMTSTPDSRREVARSDRTIVFEGRIAPTTGFIVMSTEAPFSCLAAGAIAEDFVATPGHKVVYEACASIVDTLLLANAMAASQRSTTVSTDTANLIISLNDIEAYQHSASALWDQLLSEGRVCSPLQKDSVANNVDQDAVSGYSSAFLSGLRTTQDYWVRQIALARS